MAKGFLFPGGILSMPREAAERLMKSENGDAALLYLSLLSREDGSGLDWPPSRRRAAFEALVKLDLADPEAAPTSNEAKALPEEPPDYTIEDTMQLLKEDKTFQHLVDELDRRLGKKMTTSGQKTLMVLYDYLAMPPEVILLLTNWCMERAMKKYGPGRKPTLPQIRQEGFRWHQRGIDTLEAAEDYIGKEAARGESANRLLPLIGVTGREAIDAERQYLLAWSEMGFQDDAIKLAYEKTVLKKQSMNWPYMNSILRSWHQKGLHDRAAVEREEDGKWKKQKSQAATPKATQDQMVQDMDRLDRLLTKNQGKG